MDRLTHREIIELARVRDQHLVSLYLPTVRAGGQTEQNRIRFKNRLEQARDLLGQADLPGQKIDGLLEPLRRLSLDNSFWQHQADGLAVFLEGREVRSYRLPVEFPELTVVADRYHLKPLLSYLAPGSRFFLLALDTGGVSIYGASQDAMDPLTLTGSPKSLSEFLVWDDPEDQLQWHNATGRLEFMPGFRGSMFHGHGAGAEQEVETSQLVRFFRALDNAIYQMLAGDDHPPLIVIGGDNELGHYQSVNSYPNLAAVIHRNPHQMKPEELHALAWPHIQELSNQALGRDLDRYHSLANNGQAADRLNDVVQAATMGRVETLFFGYDRVIWGNYNRDQDVVRIQEAPTSGAVDLIDLAAVETVLNGGKVHGLSADQVPGEDPVAAILRF